MALRRRCFAISEEKPGQEAQEWLRLESGRRPKPESSGKHKYAIPEAKVAPEVCEYFLETAQKTAAAGSPRKRVAGPQTAKMHWYSYRQYLGYLESAGFMDDKVDDDAERIDTATTLTDKDLIQAFYLHLEQDVKLR